MSRRRYRDMADYIDELPPPRPAPIWLQILLYAAYLALVFGFAYAWDKPHFQAALHAVRYQS